MTESEWAVCQDPGEMLKYLRGRASGRKLRLFGVACCRAIWHLLGEEQFRRAVEAAEGAADALTDPRVLQEANAAAWATAKERIASSSAATSLDSETDPELQYGLHDDCLAAPAACAAAYVSMPEVGWVSSAAHYARHAEDGAAVAQAALLRDLFGNPWHPITIAPTILAWHNGTVVKVATAIYEERRWEDMPLLGDALEDAGGDSDVLAHCRGPGPHARGCHVVDAILGRS